MVRFKFGRGSERVLTTVDPYIVHIFRKALALGLVDISCVSGRRDKEEQNALYYAEPQLSQKRYPDSKHNTEPFSDAIDAFPYINGTASYKYEHCIYLAGIIMAIDKLDSDRLRWGGDWNRDGEAITDQCFQDLGHFELIERIR